MISFWQRLELIDLCVSNYHCDKEFYPMFMGNYGDNWGLRWFYLIKINLCLFFNWYIHPAVDLNMSEYSSCIRYDFKRSYSYDGENWGYNIIQVGIGVFKDWWFFIDHDWD